MSLFEVSNFVRLMAIPHLQVPLAESDQLFAEISPDLSRCLLRVPARHSDTNQPTSANAQQPPPTRHVGELLCYSVQSRTLLFAVALPSVFTVFTFDQRFANDRVALTVLDAAHGPNSLAIAELHVHEPPAAASSALNGRSLAASHSNHSSSHFHSMSSSGAHITSSSCAPAPAPAAAPNHYSSSTSTTSSHIQRPSSSSHMTPPPPLAMSALASPALRVVATNAGVNRHAGALHPYLRQLLFSPTGLHIVVLALAALECRCRQARRYTRTVEAHECAAPPAASGSTDIIGIGIIHYTVHTR